MTEKDRGPWSETYTGRHFHYQDPQPEDVSIIDIASALSQVARYGGHAAYHYSVAQHSYYVSLVVEQAQPKPNLTEALWGLLHDAAEAYVGDTVRPFKVTEAMAAYRLVEERIMRCVCERFELPFDEPAIVKLTDRRMCVTEKPLVRSLWTARPEIVGFRQRTDLWDEDGVHPLAKPWPSRMDLGTPWSHDHAKAMFYERFLELTA